ncbi:MAG: helix-turn-helix transcriptional regulator [Clostridia bacterium]|nr:helix-turn-helix transcriptional regulator [Clostridia bacterium]
MIDFVKVGEKIAGYRKNAGLSQEELADKLFVTRQALSKWERGISIPSIDTLLEISKMFSVSPEELLGLFDGQELDVDENDIFRGHDRSFIVSKIVSGQVRVELANVFYQFSPKERMYILKHIKDGKIDCNRDELYPRLTPSEAKFLTTPRGVN